MQEFYSHDIVAVRKPVYMFRFLLANLTLDCNPEL